MIRRVLHVGNLRSLTQRSDVEIEQLTCHGHKIVVIELNGPLFFGSAETVDRRVNQELTNSDWIVLDLKRVGHLDSSGVMMLKNLDEKITKLKKRLFLSYLSEAGNQRNFLKNMGLIRPEKENRIFTDTDTALSTAEDELLKQLNCFHDKQAEVKLEEFNLLKDMTSSEISFLKALMYPSQRLKCVIIIKKGETSHSMFFLLKGMVSISVLSNDRKLCFSNFCAGSVFGETTLLLNQLSTVDVKAEDKVCLLELSSATFDKISHQQPSLGLKLTRILATQLSLRLHEANNRILTMDS